MTNENIPEKRPNWIRRNALALLLSAAIGIAGWSLLFLITGGHSIVGIVILGIGTGIGPVIGLELKERKERKQKPKK